MRRFFIYLSTKSQIQFAEKMTIFKKISKHVKYLWCIKCGFYKQNQNQINQSISQKIIKKNQKSFINPQSIYMNINVIF